MKRISFFLMLALLVVSFGLVQAQSGISLDQLNGMYTLGNDTMIIANSPVDYIFRSTNNTGMDITVLTNGFRVYTKNGTPYTPVTGDLASTWPDVSSWGFGFYINIFPQLGNTTASYKVGDTIGFGGGTISGGMVNGFDDQSYIVHTGGVAAGDTLCIDSTWYPPAGDWLWAGYSGTLNWDGPHCYAVDVPPCLPPHLTNAPTTLTGSHCDLMTFDFDAALDANDDPNNPIIFSADMGTIDPTTGVWSYQPTLADVGASLTLHVTVSNGTCDNGGTAVNLNFTNEAPVITAGCGSYSVSTSSTLNVNMAATDDCDVVSWSIVSGSGSIDPNTGVLTYTAGSSAGTETVTVQASDGNASSTCDVVFNIVAGSLYQVRMDCVGTPSGPVYGGQYVDVPVYLDAYATDLGGYDFLIAYDNSALTFQGATIGDDFGPAGAAWEYFQYRFGPDGNCGNACPSGMLRVVAIAETNNGPVHPGAMPAVPTVLFNMTFLVSNNNTFQCQSIPLHFYWMDCGDNTLSDKTGDTLYISDRVYDGVGTEPNGKDDIFDPTTGYPTYTGAQDVDCFAGDPNKPQPIPAVSFDNGCVFIACNNLIDARGDINLNGVANEIADAVLYGNYFVYGPSVLEPNFQGKVAASDVNNDGITLSVADLVYLTRLVTGDALGYPKLAPVAANITTDDGMVSVNREMGAAYVVINGNVTPDLLADNMDMKYNYDAQSNVTRVLVYSMEQGQTFNGSFLNAHGTVASVELATYEGAPVTAKVIPGKYSLAQNYPNPFNPTTTISFNLPVKADYSLVIYNVTGQRVAEFSGSSEAGTVSVDWDASNQASGIYFYKLSTNNFTSTKKMVLLK